jgi:hypothetical protein
MIKLNTDRFTRIIFDSYLRVEPKKIKVIPDIDELGECEEGRNIVESAVSRGNYGTQD